MTARSEDDSRPHASHGGPRPTARDVPIAKYKEVSAGTVPPRGLRGPSLQPGQGAPERINPEEIELAALREADTLDSPHVARAARRGPELTTSPPPTPVSVEVPRVRSVPPDAESYQVTPTTPSARSVQSGTLMSIGSIDPRAPTELSLPSPRVLTQSERAAYLGPPAVVDRTPVGAAPSASRELALRARNEFVPAAPRAARLNRELLPPSEPSGSRNSDSVAPNARNFARSPDSYSPVERTTAPSSAGLRVDPSSGAHSSRPPETEGAPRFDIHADLGAIQHELGEDNFDLRGVATTREPLASRKARPSSDWSTTGEPVSAPRDPAASERASQYPNSASAMTILVDLAPESVPSSRDSLPNSEPRPPERTTVPVTWVIGAAGFALLLALIVAWVMRAPAPPETRRLPDERVHGVAQPPLQPALPVAPTAGPSAARAAAAVSAVVSRGAEIAPSPSATLPPKEPPTNKAPRAAEALAPSATAAHSAQSLQTAPARPADKRGSPANSNDSAKPRQSIY